MQNIAVDTAEERLFYQHIIISDQVRSWEIAAPTTATTSYIWRIAVCITHNSTQENSLKGPDRDTKYRRNDTLMY